MLAHSSQHGFTIVELMVVVAIVGILAVAVSLEIDPSRRVARARDAVRQNDVETITDAILRYRLDNGKNLETVAQIVAGNAYMIVDGGMVNGCADNNAACGVRVASDTACVDLSGLVEGDYLEDIPVAPSGMVAWDSGASDGMNGTGYTLTRDTQGTVQVRACESGAGTEIKAVK